MFTFVQKTMPIKRGNLIMVVKTLYNPHYDRYIEIKLHLSRHEISFHT